MVKFDNVHQMEAYRASVIAAQATVKTWIHVCAGTGCLANGSRAVFEALKQALAAHPETSVAFTKCNTTGCHGFCQHGPLVVIEPAGIFYQKVKPKDAAEIVETILAGTGVVKRLLYRDPNSKQQISYHRDIPFYQKQHRNALRNIGKIDPFSLDDALAVGAYRALGKVLTSTSPTAVIDEITKSGLRGCGGGGFPTGKKWRSCVSVESDVRYLICNGDEGDPGAFMDRSIMEGDPHSVLEGMIIGAYAIGARQGYIYVRAEYPLAVKHLQNAIEQARERGLLGKCILGTDFEFDIQINLGGGAFVCGESSALMRSLEGKVGEPRAKYVRSVIKGLHDQPTVLNNVETWANVPLIIDKGAEWFSAMGTPTSKGSKVFSLVGKVKNTGLVEVPMGTTLREIIFEIGGGILKNRQFKAVQTGGPSGGCLPESELDLPVDFDSLTAVGSMMGSGGMIVMDSRTCMVDVARYFTKFLVEESCGKCVPCREGLRQLLAILDGITKGTGTLDDLAKIERLSETIRLGSLCALGTTATNPVESTIRYFRDEYLSHIEQKQCPAGVCTALTTFTITEACTGCGACVKVCPTTCIQGESKKIHRISQEQCIKCGACFETCPYDAIRIN